MSREQYEAWFKDPKNVACGCCNCLEDGFEAWQAGRNSILSKLTVTDFIVMGATATGSATTENTHLWDVYWKTIELLKEKITGYQKEAKK